MSLVRSIRGPARAGAATVIASALLLGVGLAVSEPAAARSATSSSASMATVRIGHLSPDMPGVDVYLKSFTGSTSVFVRDATYGQVSTYRPVRPGSYTFAVRKHGASADTAPLKTWSVETQPGYAYTAAVVGSGSDHRGVVLHDDLTPPAKGHANVRFIQASSKAGTADVDAVDGPTIAKDAGFGSSTGYASIPAGTWSLEAAGSGTDTDARVSVAAGSVTSVVLLDAPDGKTRLTSVVDAAGAPSGSAPRGSVDTGGGGTASHVVNHPDDTDLAPVLITVFAVALLLAGGAVLLRRRIVGRPTGGA